LNEKPESLDQTDLEPGDRNEKLSPVDYCLAAGCGCSGCLDPAGCATSMGQGCLGCFHACLASVGCGVIALAGLVAFAVMVVRAIV
jgi:hypothetical protein